MRVTLVTEGYFDYSIALASSLANLVDLSLVSRADWDPELREYIDDRVDIRTIDLPRISNPRRASATRQLLRVVQATDPDVVHLQQCGDPWINLQMVLHRPPQPLVMTIHDAQAHPGDGDQILGAARTQHWLAKRTDRFLVHSEVLASLTRSLWPIKNSQGIDIIPMAEMGTFTKAIAASPLSGGFDLPEDKIIRRTAAGTSPQSSQDTTESSSPKLEILFFGRRWYYKGLDVLIDALNLLTDQADQFRLVVAGGGEPIQPNLDKLDRRIEVTVYDGSVGPSQVNERFSNASIVCLPYREASQSGVLAQALGFGIPTVASDVGAMSSSINHEVNGLLVEPDRPELLAASLGRLLGSEKLREKLSRGALASARNELSWGRVAGLTLETYEKAVADNRTLAD